MNTNHAQAKRALVLSGGGRYGDPWHPFIETSAALARVLADAGFETRVSEDVDAELWALADAQPTQGDSTRPDLLVINVGNPGELSEEHDRRSRAGLLDYMSSGGRILATHSSATSFPGIPEWESILGGIWVRGTTMHPDREPSLVSVRRSLAESLGINESFVIDDEMYCWLRHGEHVEILATHAMDGVDHPIMWRHNRGSARILYDALGHDAVAYEPDEHRVLLRYAISWLIDD